MDIRVLNHFERRLATRRGAAGGRLWRRKGDIPFGNSRLGTESKE